jgi:hypothetical protein
MYILKSIFVSLASYRDGVCSTTLSSLYDQAYASDRIFVGICQQNMHSIDKDCLFTSEPKMNVKKLKEFENWKTSNVRILRIPHSQAQGPTFARYFCSVLYRHEDYFLQIDSHSLFVHHWDVKLIRMIEKLVHVYHIPKPVLSHYCDVYERYSTEPANDTVTTMTSFGLDENKMIFFLGAEYLPTLSHPRMGAFISGQMFFCSGTFLQELPFDPFLPDLFFGEEILLTLRFYTNGWDIFTPNENIIYHAYTREKEPKYWNDKTLEVSDCIQKVKYMIGMTSSRPSSLLSVDDHTYLQTYGMGNQRSVNQYWEWIGVNMKQLEHNFTQHRLPSSILDNTFPFDNKTHTSQHHPMSPTSSFLSLPPPNFQKTLKKEYPSSSLSPSPVPRNIIFFLFVGLLILFVILFLFYFIRRTRFTHPVHVKKHMIPTIVV